MSLSLSLFWTKTHVLTVWIPMFLPHWVCLLILQLRAIKGTQSKPSPVTLSSAIPHESPVFRVNPMTKLSTTAVCCTALLSTLSYHASMHVSVHHSVFSTAVWPSKFISVSLERPERCREFSDLFYREKIHRAWVLSQHSASHSSSYRNSHQGASQHSHWSTDGHTAAPLD